MRFFEGILTVVASSTRKVRYPLHKTADRTLAQILLGTWEPARLSELLVAERDRDYDDELSAVQQRAAGAVLCSLVDLPVAPWLDFLRAVSERLDGDNGIDVQDQAIALDLLLSAAVLAKDPPWVSRLLRARYKVPPTSATCAWSTPLFAEANALVSGTKHEFPDLVPFAARALSGNGAIYLALAIAQHGPRGALDVLSGGSAALDADLEGPDGKLRVHAVGEPQWHCVGATDQTAVELRARVQGTGGTVHAVPWTLPLDLLGPWYQLHELCQGEVVFDDADATKTSPRALATLLANPDGEIRITVECQGDFTLDPTGVAAIRDRLPAGVRWLRALHPSFRAQVTLQVDERLGGPQIDSPPD